MPQYAVTGYLVTPMTVWVEADTEEEALERGEDLLRDDEGYQSDPVWNDDFDAYEVVTTKED
jgi:hypothetical protein